jgi:uncharacterized membrane protein YgcG
MAQNHPSIDRFVEHVRSRLNRHRLWTTLVWMAAAAAAVLVAAGLWYTTRGYALPRVGIVWTLALAALGSAVVWTVRRLTADGAAQAADRYFRLHDAIASYLHFSRAGRTGGYYTLQAEQTERQVEPLDPRSMKYDPPRRGIVLAVCLLAIAVPLGLRGPSERVQHEQQIAADTAIATASINDELAKLVEEIRKESPNGEEKELLEPNQLREWVKELTETSDPREALRQYAALERKLNEARLALQNQRNEQLLARAARELESTRSTQPLAEQLKQKNYDGSAEQLEKMRPAESDKPLSKQQQELARLKAAALHMASAARAARSSASTAKSSAAAMPSSGKSSSADSESSGGQGSGGSGSGSGSGGDMAQTMEELAQAVDDLDTAFDEAIRQEKQAGQCDAKKLGECKACSQCVSSQLSKLTKQLNKLAMCQRTDARLCKLCQACSQCQGNLSCLCSSPNAGGIKAGLGTNTARRNQLDELIDNGMTTPLKGIKGQGPSLTTVEAANDGSGVSSRRGTARAHNFERQFESFVAREDIPDEVKDGVKQYFEVIHQLTPEPTREESPPDADHGT